MSTNYTPETARVVASLPYSDTDDVTAAPTGSGYVSTCDSAQRHAVWYAFTPAAGQTYIAVNADVDAAGNYDPVVSIWTGTPPALTQFQIASQEFCADLTGGFWWNVPVVPGTTYYFQVVDDNASSPLGSNLVFQILEQPALAAPVSSIAIPDFNAGFPITIISSADASIRRYVSGPASERGQTLQTGEICTQDLPSTDVVVMDSSFAPIATVSFADDVVAIVSDQVDTFFVITQNATDPLIVSTVSKLGVLGGTTWTLPANSSTAKCFAVNRTQTILYYGNASSNDVIRRYDLVAHSALSDLHAAFAGERLAGIGDGWVLLDGSICFGYCGNAGLNVTPRVRRFSSAGTVLNTYDLTSANFVRLNHITFDNDAVGAFWAWGFDTSQNFNVFKQVRYSDGVVLIELPPVAVVVDGFSQVAGASFGVSNSCPFFILQADLPPVDCVPVTISSQPNGLTIDSGQSAVLTVTAVGTSPITYQWYEGASGDTSNPVVGANSAEFVTPVLTATTTYWVSVSNPCGMDDSLSATVTVPPPPDPPTIPPSKTLIFDIKASRWFADAYPSAVLARTWEPGAGVHDQVLGHQDGSVDVFSGHQDHGAAIPYIFQPPDVDGGDPRRDKVFGDAFIEADTKGGPGFVVTPGYNDYQTLLTTQLLGAGLSGRQPLILDINGGIGQMARNFGIAITGSDSVGPVFFLWEPSFVPKAEITDRRATDWENCGMDGAKFLQGVIVQADTGGVDKRILVQYGTLFSEEFTINDTVEAQTPYSFVDPFVAHLVRIVPVDDVPWHYYGTIWKFQPFPELVSVYQTPPTTKDFPGYSQDERALIGHISTVDFDLVVVAGSQTFTYRIPHSSGVYRKTPVMFAPNKGLWYSYACRVVGGSQSLRLFLQDCEIRSRAWGSPSGYAPLRIFGEQSREASSARI